MAAAKTSIAIQMIPKSASREVDEDNDAGEEDDEYDDSAAPPAKTKSRERLPPKNPTSEVAVME